MPRHSSSEDSGTERIVVPQNLTSRVLQMMHDDQWVILEQPRLLPGSKRGFCGRSCH